MNKNYNCHSCSDGESPKSVMQLTSGKMICVVCLADRDVSLAARRRGDTGAEIDYKPDDRVPLMGWLLVGSLLITLILGAIGAMR